MLFFTGSTEVRYSVKEIDFTEEGKAVTIQAKIPVPYTQAIHLKMVEGLSSFIEDVVPEKKRAKKKAARTPVKTKPGATVEEVRTALEHYSQYQTGYISASEIRNTYFHPKTSVSTIVSALNKLDKVLALENGSGLDVKVVKRSSGGGVKKLYRIAS